MREHDIRPPQLLDEFFARLRRDAAKLAGRRAEFVSVPCPFCGGIGEAESFEKEEFRYVSCRGCQSLYASPRPTPALLREYLETSEAVEYWSTHFYRQTAEARRAQMFRPRAARIAGLANQYRLPADSRCADIGAGYGLFLEELRGLTRFAQVVAIEPDARLAEVCRSSGFAVAEKWVEDIADGELSADVAVAFEVLEHVFAPVDFLRAAARVVRPGGWLFFSTLASSGFDIQILWEQSRSISPPQHLNFPSVTGARLVMERAGLEVVEITTPGQLDLDIVRNRIAGDDSIVVPRFVKRLTAADDETRAAFQRFLQEHQLSSHIQCVARRRG